MTRRECDAIRPFISAALDGELDEHEFVQLSEHLATCPECRQINEDYSTLRSGIREIPRPTPPPQLAQTIRRETVEKPPPPFIIQLASRTGVRWGMSTMAASIVGLLVAVLFLAHGIDQRSTPAIASSQPVQESTQEWSINRPIEIAFSKQMDRESVEDNLIIWPSSEQDRLPIDWSGNTLIIGRSDERSVLLLPETDYRITILEHARDQHGNPIGDFWMLRFRTGPPDVAISTPTPGQDSEPESDDRADLGQSEWAFSQSDDGDDQVTPTPRTDSDSQSNSTSESSSSGQIEDSGGSPAPSSGDPTSEPTAEPSPTQETVTPPPPSPTAVPDSEAEPTQPRATPAPDPAPTPRPEPTPEPTPEPEPSATPEPPGVRGPFGEVYWSNDSVQNALGTPMSNSITFLASELEFQRGLMFRQYHLNRNSIFVFVNGGRVELLDNTYDPDRHSFPFEDKGNGVFQPGGEFGKVWSEQEHLQQAIGYAVSSAPEENVDAAIQQFDRGIMLFSRGNIYIIYGDMTWDVFPVRSGANGGYQGDDPDREADLIDEIEDVVPDDIGDENASEEPAVEPETSDEPEEPSEPSPDTVDES